jgi:hypothetical protein
MIELPHYRRMLIASSLSMAWASATEALTSKLHDSLVLYHESQEEIAALKKELATLKAAAAGSSNE